MSRRTHHEGPSRPYHGIRLRQTWCGTTLGLLGLSDKVVAANEAVNCERCKEREAATVQPMETRP